MSEAKSKASAPEAKSKASTPAETLVGEALAGVHPDFAKLIDRKELGAILAAVNGPDVTPRIGLVFEWLRYFGPADARGLVIGQDPYPQDAVGLSFSKPRECKVDASSANIFACLHEHKLAVAQPGVARHCDLRPWAAQGVLLANTALTTRRGERKAHEKEWGAFTSRLFRAIFDDARARKRSLFCLLWGGPAREFAQAAKERGHVAFEWTHPSPLSNNKVSDNLKFAKNPCFARANEHLVAHGTLPLTWDNMGTVVAFADGSCNPNKQSPESVAGFAALVVGAQFGKNAVKTSVQGLVQPHPYKFVDEAHPEAGFVADESAANEWPSNNRGELLGACWAYLMLLRGCALGKVEVVCDSSYVVNTVSEWYAGWEREGIVDGKKNPDLLRILMRLQRAVAAAAATHTITRVDSHQTKRPPKELKRELFLWDGNLIVDAMCNDAREQKITGRITSPIYLVRTLINTF